MQRLYSQTNAALVRLSLGSMQRQVYWSNRAHSLIIAANDALVGVREYVSGIPSCNRATISSNDGRAVGSVAQHCTMSSRQSSGQSSGIGGRALWLATSSTTSNAVLPSYGTLRVKTSHCRALVRERERERERETLASKQASERTMTIPNENTSADTVYRLLRRISGAVQHGVPTSVISSRALGLSALAPASSIRLRPKSATLQRQCSSTKRLWLYTDSHQRQCISRSSVQTRCIP